MLMWRRTCCVWGEPWESLRVCLLLQIQQQLRRQQNFCCCGVKPALCFVVWCVSLWCVLFSYQFGEDFECKAR